MSIARLSSKGQLIIPKHIRNIHCWEAGQELEVIDTADGVLLASRTPFPATSIDDLKQLKACSGPCKSLDDMDDAIHAAIRDNS